jgi:hypothetical protein
MMILGWRLCPRGPIGLISPIGPLGQAKTPANYLAASAWLITGADAVVTVLGANGGSA